MTRNITIITDKQIEVPGLGLYGPEPDEEGNPTFLDEPAKYVFSATDVEIATWEAVNGREWPEDGINVGVAVETEPDPQGNLFDSVDKPTEDEN